MMENILNINFTTMVLNSGAKNSHEAVDYLINKTMGDLMHAEQNATIDTFKLNNFKFREILLSEINEGCRRLISESR